MFESERSKQLESSLLEVVSDGAGVDAAERVGAGDAGHASAAVLQRAAGGLSSLDVVRPQVDAAVQVPPGGGGVGGGHPHLRRRDPRAGRLAHPQGTPPMHMPVPRSFAFALFSFVFLKFSLRARYSFLLRVRGLFFLLFVSVRSLKFLFDDVFRVHYAWLLSTDIHGSSYFIL